MKSLLIISAIFAMNCGPTKIEIVVTPVLCPACPILVPEKKVDDDWRPASDRLLDDEPTCPCPLDFAGDCPVSCPRK